MNKLTEKLLNKCKEYDFKMKAYIINNGTLPKTKNDINELKKYVELLSNKITDHNLLECKEILKNY